MMYNSERSGWGRRRFFFFPLFAAFVLGLGALVMVLWNAILPEVINATSINYWQALGLLVLSRILFGGFKFGPGYRRHYGNPEWKEKMMNMSEEERIKFKDQWRERCKPGKE